MGFRKIVLDPKEDPRGFHLTQIQDNVAQSLKEIEFFPLLRGVFVDYTLVSGQDNAVNHGLGRDYAGWFIVNIDQNATVWCPNTVNEFKSKQIILRCSVGATVKIYIF